MAVMVVFEVSISLWEYPSSSLFQVSSEGVWAAANGELVMMAEEEVVEEEVQVVVLKALAMVANALQTDNPLPIIGSLVWAKLIS